MSFFHLTLRNAYLLYILSLPSVLPHSLPRRSTVFALADENILLSLKLPRTEGISSRL